MTIKMNEATGLPWRYPSPYVQNANLRQTVRGLAAGTVTTEKIEWLAVHTHKLTPWAGKPIPWDEISEEQREEQREFAQWALEHAQ
jgi:hypothetical protein